MKLALLTTTVVILISAVGPCLPAKILAVLPFPGKSHFIFNWSVFKVLTEHGHQVVEYSPFTPSIPMKNYSHVRIHSRMEQTLGKLVSYSLYRSFFLDPVSYRLITT